MKAKTILCCFLFLLLSLSASCSNSYDNKPKINPPTKISNLEQKLNEINHKIETAVLENDYETILKYYAEDVFIAPNFNPPLRGKSALREGCVKQQKEGVKFHSFNTKAEKIREDNLNVYEYGSYGMSVSSNETKLPYAFTGSYFTVWEKQKDESLLIKYLISNLDFNPHGYYD